MIKASSDFRASPSGSSQTTAVSKGDTLPIHIGFLSLLFLFSLMLTVSSVHADQITDTFSKFEAGADTKVDHAAWDGLLKSFVKPTESGLNVVDYGRFKAEARSKLTAYLEHLQKTDVTKLNKREQYAYWVNLYNAKTVDIILEHYPVKSIRDIDISPGLFSNGPWKKKVVTVNKTELSLDDIEHVILRGLWKDNRVHYAVNCASIGCPNLATAAFTGDNLEQMLDAGARAYINSPRGMKIDGNRLIVSKIYSWFSEDFGNSEADLIRHLRRYAGPKQAEKLKSFNDIDKYVYDWNLNGIEAQS